MSVLRNEDYAATLGEVGAVLRVSQERARMVQESGLRTLRKQVKKYGLAAGDADLVSQGQGDPAVYCQRAICVDCDGTTGDATEARCPSCRRYEIARAAGHAEGDFSGRTFLSGALNILRRWPGTTT